MKPLNLSFCFLTILLATGFYTLLKMVGPEPSSQLTLLIVLVSALLLKLITHGVRRYKAWRQHRRGVVPQATLITEEEEEEITHENQTGY